jgi:NifU-like protein involved in Fe-S cluster formation
LLNYSQKVADHFFRPRNLGTPAGGPATLFSGEAGVREQGVQVVFNMRVADRNIAEIRFQAFACPHTIAACSLATERLEGAPVGALLEMSPDVLMEELQVPTEKMGRMLVVQDALRNCFADWDNSGLP